jgi:hypothetical protein
MDIIRVRDRYLMPLGDGNSRLEGSENSHKYKVSRSTSTYKKNSRMLFNIKFQNAYKVAL